MEMKLLQNYTMTVDIAANIQKYAAFMSLIAITAL